MEIGGLRFQDPLWLLGFLAVPLVLGVAWLREARAPALVLPGASRLRSLRATWRIPLRWLALLLTTGALLVGSVALARPQKGSLKESVTTRGVDIVVALDVSGSMAAEDFQPRNRLAVAKEVVSEFVHRRMTDRVGLVVFAAKSLTKAPPTTDQAVLLRQLEDVHLDMLPDGTAIGSGMATALTRLRRSKARSRVIVLVTDGGNNAGEIDPTTATDLARAMQVRVYTIGVGREGEVPMPVVFRDPMTGAEVKKTIPMEVKFDETLLQRIASQTGGEYFRAADAAGLRGVFDRINRLEKSEIKLTAFRRYRELYLPFLVGAAVLLMGAGVARATGWRVTPA
jgi:Ca-activated chloride channel family protein